MEIPFLNKITIFGRGINQATKNRNTAFMKTIEQIKNSIAQEKGYPSWTQFYNFVSRDGEHAAVVAQQVESAMQEVLEAHSKLAVKAILRSHNFEIVSIVEDGSMIIKFHPTGSGLAKWLNPKLNRITKL